MAVAPVATGKIRLNLTYHLNGCVCNNDKGVFNKESSRKPVYRHLSLC